MIDYAKIRLDLAFAEMPEQPVIYQPAADDWKWASQEDLDNLQDTVRKFIFRPDHLMLQYKQDFAAAENPKGTTLSEQNLAFKLLEEAVEVAIACGHNYSKIAHFVSGCVFRESMKSGSPDEIGAVAVRNELADVCIVAETLAGFYPGQPHHSFIEAKRKVNLQRLWRVNEFGTLSNRGTKS